MIQLNSVDQVQETSRTPVVAKAASGGQSYQLVLFSGVATSALTLLGVYLLDVSGSDFHIMGWYADYVLPVGGIIAGVAASSGYGLASWFTGVKITRSLLWTVLAIQVMVYFGAQYIEFSHLRLVHLNGSPVGFFEYYDHVARAFAWKHDDGGRGEPLGLWGYFFRGLEIIGFAGGSLIVPLVLWKWAYCQTCSRYMRTRQLSLLAASVPVKKIKKADTTGQAAHVAEQKEAFERGQRITEILQKMAVDGQAAEFQRTLTELEPRKKQAAKLPHRLGIHLVSCKQCRSGWLLVKLFSGQGKQLKTTELGRTDVQPEFVRSIQP